MSEKMLKTRIMNKYDTEANWSKATFTPLKGELIIYAEDENYNYKRVKIGDGVTPLNDLSFHGAYDEEIQELQAQVDKLEYNTMDNSDKIDKLEYEFSNIELTPGKDGADGLSAYEIACNYGFDGSEEEWLDSLHGKDGVDGIDGKDGSDGYDGKDGVDGVDGKDGATPYIGDNGNWFVNDKDTGCPSTGKDAVTPKFKIEGGYWYVSYDAEHTEWEQLLDEEGNPIPATGESGASFFNNVTPIPAKDNEAVYAYLI